jgi:hypothetical protein
MPTNDFDQFRQRVLATLALQEELREIEDHDEFILKVVELGGDHGFSFNVEDVKNAMNASRRSWIERWI